MLSICDSPTHLVAHLHFSNHTKPNEKMQKSYQSHASQQPDTTDKTTTERGAADNKVLPQWGLTCFYETFVGKRTAVLLLNISAKNPPLRQYPNRCRQWLDTSHL